MSDAELMRLRVLIDVADRGLSVEDASGLLGVGRRQICRLLEAFRACGPDGPVILEPSEPAKAAIGKRVTVVDYPGGRVAIRYRRVDLSSIAPSISSAKSTKRRLPTTNSWVPSWR